MLQQALVDPNLVLRREASYVVYCMALEFENLPADGIGFVAPLLAASADPLTDWPTRMRMALILEKIGRIMKTRLTHPCAPGDGRSLRDDVRFLRPSARAAP